MPHFGIFLENLVEILVQKGYFQVETQCSVLSSTDDTYHIYANSTT